MQRLVENTTLNLLSKEPLDLNSLSLGPEQFSKIWTQKSIEYLKYNQEISPDKLLQEHQSKIEQTHAFNIIIKFWQWLLMQESEYQDLIINSLDEYLNEIELYTAITGGADNIFLSIRKNIKKPLSYISGLVKELQIEHMRQLSRFCSDFIS